MPEAAKVTFVSYASPARDVLVVFCDDALTFGPATRKALGAALAQVKRAIEAARFKGKSLTALELLVPNGLKAARLIVVGTGKSSDIKDGDFIKFGGAAMGRVPASAKDVLIMAEFPHAALKPAQVAQMAAGARLRTYSFDRYKTRKKDDDKAVKANVSIAAADTAAARRAFTSAEAVVEGALLARELVNEPPNVLFPEEFARRASRLRKHRVQVEVLNVRAMARLKMGALLGVGQGAHHESRLVVLRWNGGRRGEAPIAFIGKGVCFDSGGISIKPSGSMEEMKGDMAGAACVTGLMQALAARKARVNAVGVLGLVENMPDGNAQRPGDIVTSMSGQTIEIINTDAEGRLVLADALWYAAKKFKPKMMIDLATLTGAIMVALGQEYAGLFSNNDELAERLTEAGQATGERVWRMPLGPEYDKQIDSKFADMKNTGGRNGGSITAAQFLQRFVDSVPWAHIDIAGTAMASPSSDINQSWGSGFGVRLLDRLIADYYEK
jgi:leucyl aminopeptidase